MKPDTKSIALFSALFLMVLFQAMETRGQYIIREGNVQGEILSRSLVLPYVFSTETLGLGLGLGGSYAPASQPESTYFGTVYGTDNGSWLGALGGNNLKLPHVERLYMRPYMILRRDTHMRVYTEGPRPPDPPPAGSNESSPDDYIEIDAHDGTASFEMNYILPWGHYRDNTIHTYVTQQGILKENPSGAESVNPLQSGKTSILFRPYYRKQFTDDLKLETLNFTLGIEHDNRDFVPNPHRGYLAKANIAHDPDWLAETRNWTSLEGEIDGYIPLPDTSWSRQQTIAISLWTAYSPSYSSDPNDVSGRPPYYAGPTLGGLWRMRAYPDNRFHDKSAICYTAEYRIMPEWQPLGRVDTLDPLKIRWWQIIGLVEVGRVAPQWDFETLHSDMKYDFGIGLRGMFDRAIGRIDFVVCDEGMSITAMLGQAF